MARDEAALSTCMIVSDYVPAHYKWTEDELAALGNCQATADIIKKRLEDNGAKVKEMYAIEHKGENKVAKEYHSDINETKAHYHILVKFEPSHGATLKDIANFIGVPMEFIEKPKPGRYSFDNMLSYLIHIKYEKKLQYAPADVVTIAGTDYIDYYNERRERWIKARGKVGKKGKKSRDRLFREVIAKMEAGYVKYLDLFEMEEYREVLFEPKYEKEIIRKNKCLVAVAETDHPKLLAEIKQNKITSLDEIMANDRWRLAYKFERGDTKLTIDKALAAAARKREKEQGDN